MQNHITYDEEQKTRLDLFLTTYFENTRTRSYWQKMIKNGYITVDGEQVKLAHTTVRQGNIIDIAWPDDRPSAVEFPVVYEDADVLVINKPAGVLAHSKGAFNPEYTVADFAQAHATETFEGDRPGIVHRLDRVTSGIMIIAKHPSALKHLQKQFAERKAKKVYVAVTDGELKDLQYEVNLPIARNPKKPQTFRVHRSGKSARTRILRIKAEKRHSVAVLVPETGRTHQLRVHLSHMGYPIVGDQLYGAKKRLDGNRILLHAYQLEITLPSKKRETFIASIPEDMSSYIHADDIKPITSSLK